MTYTRYASIAALLGGLAACGAPAQQQHVGPTLGESTAPGPSNSSAPAPDNGGPREVSARVHGDLTATPNPVITVDTMPSTTTGTSGNGTNTSGAMPSNNPASGTDNATFYAPGVVVPGAANTTVAGRASAGSTSGNPVGAGNAGPNGPGTGNGPATSTTTAPGTTQVPAAQTPTTGNTPVATPSPTTPATPTPSPATPQPVAPITVPAPQIPVSPR